MSIVPARSVSVSVASIARAAEILRAGGLVAFPTETVYGLGADARNDRAVAAIFAAKHRPQFNPLIVHVPGASCAESLVTFDSTARKLAKSFWPGALTLVLPRRANSRISLLASAGLDTLAVRVPSHDVAQRLLAEADMPIAAPSANPSGRVSATSAAHVSEELAHAAVLILDGGPAPLGLESTIVGFENGSAVLFRPGAISREAIEAVAGPLKNSASENIASPGRLASHYAPNTPLRLDAPTVAADEALLAFGPPLEGARVERNLSISRNLDEAAANLFAMLRELDAAGCERVAVMPIPEHGLGEAINDRLRRAAAPREN